MKYVMVRDGDHVYPIIFPDRFVHEDIGNAFAQIIRDYQKDGKISRPVEFVSAGDVNLGFDVKVGGHSTTLKIAHRPKDADVIMAGQYMAYWEGLDDCSS